jgi:hypothetical protein
MHFRSPSGLRSVGAKIFIFNNSQSAIDKPFGSRHDGGLSPQIPRLEVVWLN